MRTETTGSPVSTGMGILDRDTSLEIVRPELGRFSKMDIREFVVSYMNSCMERSSMKVGQGNAEQRDYDLQRLHSLNLECYEKDQQDPKATHTDTRYHYTNNSKNVKGAYSDKKMIIGRMFNKEVRTPDYVIYDLYNLAVTPDKRLSFGKIDHKNQWQYDLLMKFYNIYLKQVTEKSPVYASVVVGEMVLALEMQIAERFEKSQQDSTDEDQVSECLSKMSGTSGESSEEMDTDQVMDSVQDRIKEIDEMMEFGLDEDVRDVHDTESEPGDGASKDDDTGIRRAKNLMENLSLLGNVDLSSHKVKEFVQESMRMGRNYFSDIYETVDESILEAEELDQMDGVEYLLEEIFGMSHIEDVTSEEKHHYLKFNVYIDCSGSMGQDLKLGDSTINTLTLCQLTAVKMMEMGVVNEVRFFNDNISEPTESKSKVITVDRDGGTEIELVLQKIEEDGKPSVVLTDMNDDYSTYTDNAFIIGVNGANMGGGDEEVKDLYLERGQFMYFDQSKGEFIKPKEQ